MKLAYSLVATSLVFVSSAASPAHAQGTPHVRPARLQRYELFLIRPFAAGSTATTSAASVNDLGQVTGMSTASEQRAFLWTVAGGAVDLGERANALSSMGRDVNLSGMVAGSSDTATIWTGVGALVPIPAPAGTYAAFAYGLNDAGRVVGEANLTPNLTTAWVWDPLQGTRNLRDLGVPGAATAAAINESNQIVGQRLTSNYLAYRFDLNAGILTDLGTFGGPTSEALGIDDLGRVVGWAKNANFNTRPFLWTPAAGLQDLGSLGGHPYDFGKARSINVASEIVGESTTTSGERHAFLWDPAHGLRDLNALVDGLGTFRLVTASRISNTGWIVGDGRDSAGGAPLGYVLRPR